MAASTYKPLVGVARAIGLLLLIPVALALVDAGFEAAYFLQGRPADAASMAGKRDVDLAASAGSIDTLRAVLGPPAGQANSTLAANATYYWWWRDSAVRVTAVEGAPIFIDVGSDDGLHLLPYRRPVFPGSIAGLRIGDPAPAPAEAASLKARTEACCEGSELTWDVKDGRVSALHLSRPHSYQFTSH